ncbi:MAG: GerAB/ArcD/ProY family transporter [Bacillota bacterium]
MISSRQLMVIIALSRLSVIFVFMPVMTAANALQDAWIAVIVATAVGALLGALAAQLARRFPDDTYGTLARAVWGKIPGAAATVILGLLFYAIVLMRARQMAFLLIATELQQAPAWAFTSTLILGAIYGALLGPDALGRTAEILFTIIMASVLLGVVLLFAAAPVDLGLLRPVLARGLEPVLVASMNPVFWFASSAATVLVLTRYTVEVEQVTRAAVLAVIISGAVLLIMALLATVSLGPHEAQRQISPLISMARIIFIRGAVERLDLVALSIWVLGLNFDAALFLMTATILLADGLGLKFRPLLFSLGASALLLTSLRITDIFMIRRILDPLSTGVATLVVYVGLIGLTLAAAVLRGKGYDREDE